ncbi:ATP-binding domain-containing protein [Micromonospora chersina]|uniref:ATP-binding domain-containing protein n=1 Tax=Micromonospora chersina TaxID=47854 RepID=UPI0033F1627B
MPPPKLCDSCSNGGTVGVIAPADRIAGLLAVLSEVPVLTATQSKGLEWDATLLIDPQGIAAEPRGWNRLYVALTRCTQELGHLTLTQQSPHPRTTSPDVAVSPRREDRPV